MAMNTSLGVGILLLVPASLMFSGSAVLFCRGKSVPSFLPLAGAGWLVAVVLCHLSEALQLFPLMHWGSRIGLVITSIFGVLFLVSLCFQ